jgi:hypothetical protein
LNTRKPVLGLDQHDRLGRSNRQLEGAQVLEHRHLPSQALVSCLAIDVAHRQPDDEPDIAVAQPAPGPERAMRQALAEEANVTDVALIHSAVHASENLREHTLGLRPALLRVVPPHHFTPFTAHVS